MFLLVSGDVSWLVRSIGGGEGRSGTATGSRPARERHGFQARAAMVLVEVGGPGGRVGVWGWEEVDERFWAVWSNLASHRLMQP
jgi:hypothetical protein